MTCRVVLLLAAVAAASAVPTGVSQFHKKTAAAAGESPCSLPVLKGQCEGTQIRFAFHAEVGGCKDFVYGGCSSNANNFRTLAECLDTCPNTMPSVDPIHKPVDPVPIPSRPVDPVPKPVAVPLPAQVATTVHPHVKPANIDIPASNDAQALATPEPPKHSAVPLPAAIAPPHSAVPLPAPIAPPHSAVPLPAVIVPAHSAVPLPAPISPPHSAVPLPAVVVPAHSAVPLPAVVNQPYTGFLPTVLPPTHMAVPLPAAVAPQNSATLPAGPPPHIAVPLPAVVIPPPHSAVSLGPAVVAPAPSPAGVPLPPTNVPLPAIVEPPTHTAVPLPFHEKPADTPAIAVSQSAIKTPAVATPNSRAPAKPADSAPDALLATVQTKRKPHPVLPEPIHSRSLDDASPEMSPVMATPTTKPPATPAINCEGVTCPNDAYLGAYYTELGCKPVFNSGNPCCVARYDCSSDRTELRTDRCYHDGHEYAVGQEVPEKEKPKCNVHCRCQKSEYDEYPRIQCVNIECAELFNGPPPPGCVRQHTHGKCCSTGTLCPPAQNSTATPLPQCDFEGKKYMEGEQFYSARHPCLNCICTKNHDSGLMEADCQKAKCLLQFNNLRYLRRNCVPVFFKDTCCPIDFRCPDDLGLAPPAVNASAPININPVAIPPASAALANGCKFGSRDFLVGEELSSVLAGECVRCSCSLPPHPTCVKTEEGCTRSDATKH